MDVEEAMHSPEVLKAMRTDLERKILRAIEEFEADSNLHVTRIEVRSRVDEKSGVPKCDRVVVTAQIH